SLRRSLYVDAREVGLLAPSFVAQGAFLIHGETIFRRIGITLALGHSVVRPVMLSNTSIAVEGAPAGVALRGKRHDMQAMELSINGERQVRTDWSGDIARALDNVVLRKLPMFYKRAIRYLGNVPDAEDAVQDALLSAYKNLAQFRGQAQISTWFTTIVINAARMQLRRRRGTYLSLDQPQGEDGLTFSELLTDSKPSPEEICSTSEAHDRLVNIVQRLTPTLRRAFQLRHIDGLTTKEAAHLLGIPEGTVKAQLARAHAKISRIMRVKACAHPRPFSPDALGSCAPDKAARLVP
ncbi:MAG TPA: sigma-70 family RNA polymerase sigma factor, partial [Terriglobales bacterium]|nr:sigma-70 family RNA polymerase sigma factor [Terriglobales bacterium]